VGWRRPVNDSLRDVLVGVLAFVLIVGCAAAQVEAGQLAGIVSDPSGAVVPSATVSVKNVGTNAVRTVKTETNGSYVISALEPAIYEVTIEAKGFSLYTSQLEITVGGHVTLDVKIR
jgi:hypothetical protein